MKLSKNKHSLGIVLIATGAICLILYIVVYAPYYKPAVNIVNSNNIVDLINQERTLQSQPNLKIDSDLMKAAQKRAEDMAKQKIFDHYGPDGSNPWDYIQNSNYNYVIAGENLAISNSSDSDIVDSWMQSITHKNNILNADFYNIGMGSANFGAFEKHLDSNIIVVLFASKAKEPLTKPGVTSPAGTISIFNNINNTSKLFIGLFATLIIVGFALEFIQIKKHNHSNIKHNS